MKRLLDLIKNKFFLVTLAFVIWMVFFDKNDVFSQYEYRQQLNKLKQEQEFYKTETEKVKNDLNELSSDKAKLEKFAREKYLMKKDNEDVFVILHDKKK
ncbi:septum formation initiator family protein [Mucilaginibacter achroorhodeus]|uniref:Septum formation initiator family protein n=1 Tax=Mucilaginibacter achroorhodeus TaxID=2599294 RepID=A0A563TYX2_9SPHI|nr:septum formation initiator family protein [Mucilaginibacter achroorhodeus]TWR24567.1 septum formation initiator family protein [Mucilaginibacter achroorhodeus]